MRRIASEAVQLLSAKPCEPGRTTLRLLTGGLLGGLLATRGSGRVRAQADTDGDQLFDEDEINVYGTLPNNPDTDGDQANDGLEIWNRDQGLGDPDDPLVPDNPATPPPPDMAPPPAATCSGLGGACAKYSDCCPVVEHLLCCLDANGAGTCTDVAANGTFLCPDPGVPDAGCPGRTIDCGGGVCIDLQIDHGNCGFCGNACPFGSNCTNGTCAVACPAGQTYCGYCTDLMSDQNNCGVCYNLCDSGVCTGGTCAPVCFGGGTVCTEDYECCSGDCGLDEILGAGVCV